MLNRLWLSRCESEYALSKWRFTNKSRHKASLFSRVFHFKWLQFPFGQTEGGQKSDWIISHTHLSQHDNSHAVKDRLTLEATHKASQRISGCAQWWKRRKPMAIRRGRSRKNILSHFGKSLMQAIINTYNTLQSWKEKQASRWGEKWRSKEWKEES